MTAPVETNSDFLKCPIFYNHNILVGKQSQFLKSRYPKGIRYINDLYKGQKLMSYEEFKNSTNIPVNSLHHLGVIRAVSSYKRKVTLKHAISL